MSKKTEGFQAILNACLDSGLDDNPGEILQILGTVFASLCHIHNAQHLLEGEEERIKMAAIFARGLEALIHIEQVEGEGGPRVAAVRKVPVQ